MVELDNWRHGFVEHGVSPAADRSGRTNADELLDRHGSSCSRSSEPSRLHKPTINCDPRRMRKSYSRVVLRSGGGPARRVGYWLIAAVLLLAVLGMFWMNSRVYPSSGDLSRPVPCSTHNEMMCRFGFVR